VIAIAALFWWSRRAAPALGSGTCRGCNVLLITIDTLRTDRVSAFGGRLDRFVREAPPSRYAREIAEFRKLLRN